MVNWTSDAPSCAATRRSRGNTTRLTKFELPATTPGAELEHLAKQREKGQSHEQDHRVLERTTLPVREEAALIDHAETEAKDGEHQHRTQEHPGDADD